MCVVLDGEMLDGVKTVRLYGGGETVANNMRLGLSVRARMLSFRV